MIGNRFRRTVSAFRSADSSETRRRLKVLPAIESLEGRQLLSGFTGLSASRNVVVHGSVYNISVTGGGFEAVRAEGRGQFNLSLFGTTSQSTVNVSLTSFRPRLGIAPISFSGIQVRSGELGTINAGGATIDGIVSPLSGLKSFNVGSISGNARLYFSSSPSTFNVGSIDLASGGEIYVQGDLTAPLTVSSLTLNGGNFTIGQDATGAMNFGSLTLENGGVFSVGRNVTNGITVNGNLIVSPSGGELNVGGNLTGLTVDGVIEGKGTNTKSPDINVGLNLVNLTVQGATPNQGSIYGADIEAGKNITNLLVAHGIFDSFIYAGVEITGGSSSTGSVGPDGADSIVNSQIQAGVEINQMTIGGNVRSTFVTNPNSPGYPTRIIAGEVIDPNMHNEDIWTNGGLIDNFQILGAMYDSVIAASVAPYGGNGSLPVTGYNIPAPAPNPPVGTGYYNAPNGYIEAGTFADPLMLPNYTETNVLNETVAPNTSQDFLTKTQNNSPNVLLYNVNPAYDTSVDPNVHDTVMFGAINPSFASAPNTDIALVSSVTNSKSTGNNNASIVNANSATSTSSYATPVPLPTKSTVVGGVFSTPHGPGTDYAGIYAADTRGVFVGSLPSGG
jgi:hypothetical protein